MTISLFKANIFFAALRKMCHNSKAIYIFYKSISGILKSKTILNSVCSRNQFKLKFREIYFKRSHFFAQLHFILRYFFSFLRYVADILLCFTSKKLDFLSCNRMYIQFQNLFRYKIGFKIDIATIE